MKKSLFLALLIIAGTVSNVTAQDVIMKRDGSEIRAKVVEVTSTTVKYNLYDNQDGPAYVVPKTDLFRIKYEGGRIEVFTESQTDVSGTPATSQSATNMLPPEQPVRTPVTMSPYQANWKEQMQVKAPYLYQKYQRRNRLKNIGWIVTGGGLILASVGFATAEKEEISRTATSVEYKLTGSGAPVAMIGSFCTVSGVVVTIIGYSQRRRVKNEYLMQYGNQYTQKSPQQSPHLEILPNGLAFVF
jgi:hypothetical protein